MLVFPREAVLKLLGVHENKELLRVSHSSAVDVVSAPRWIVSVEVPGYDHFDVVDCLGGGVSNSMIDRVQCWLRAVARTDNGSHGCERLF